ncbi:MAG: cobalamin biosynthesis protein [Deltaproteobacteria bacterium]|nr:cobalamin biosynthesis protein [Deltaproteobacteria bacterium]
MRLEVFQVTDRGGKAAGKVKAHFKDAIVHRPEEIKGGRLKGLVRNAMKGGDALVFVCAAGIAVRAVAPFLKGKETDPAVVVMDDSARFAISLLSGHLGGANALTKDIARICGAKAVISTATDIHGLPCVEDIAKKFTLAIEDVKKIKIINSAVLDNRKVYVIDAIATRAALIKKSFGKSGGNYPRRAFDFRSAFPAIPLPRSVFVCVSPFTKVNIPPRFVSRTLILRPKEFVFGTGCMKGVGLKEVEAAFNAALKRSGVAARAVRNVATIDVKRRERGLNAFVRKNGFVIEYFDKDTLNAAPAPSGVSKAALAATGAAGVAECAALVSARVKKIWLKKIKVGRVTAAMAWAPFTS